MLFLFFILLHRHRTIILGSDWRVFTVPTPLEGSPPPRSWPHPPDASTQPSLTSSLLRLSCGTASPSFARPGARVPPPPVQPSWLGAHATLQSERQAWMEMTTALPDLRRALLLGRFAALGAHSGWQRLQSGFLFLYSRTPGRGGGWIGGRGALFSCEIGSDGPIVGGRTAVWVVGSSGVFKETCRSAWLLSKVARSQAKPLMLGPVPCCNPGWRCPVSILAQFRHQPGLAMPNCHVCLAWVADA